jgi:phosphoribosyl 1,2-cyclic phosphate phosphodiesterase
MKITILGSGTSTGVPVLGCSCNVCMSPSTFNKRWRASILIQTSQGQNIVVDTGPEFRLQALRAGIRTLQHVIYTHIHADHLHGFDDLRGLYFNSGKPIDIFLDRDYVAELRHRFHYAFEDTGYLGGRPKLNLIELPHDFESMSIAGVDVETARMPHGNVTTNVIKIGRFLYATDFKYFTDEAVRKWRDEIDVMIATGLRWDEHKTHSTISETIDLFKRLRVRRGILTHLSHQVDYERDSPKISGAAEFAYDGMSIEL